MSQITAELTSGHADDCKDCEETDIIFIQTITSNVHIAGDFDDAQRKGLARIVERRPVRKTLTNGVRITDNATFD